MLYLIGLGLDAEGISQQGLEIAKRCKKIYLEGYTVDFPYSVGQIKKLIGKKFISADRELVESLAIVDEARKKDVALLIYGSPLTATTHITLLEEAKNSGVKCRVIYAASILDAVAETGLQLYKFGKITSMPKWDEEKNFTPSSFIEIIKENQSIKAHSLILVDIGLRLHKAIEQLLKANTEIIKLNKILVCSKLGTKHAKIYYDDVENLKNKKIDFPYCLIIPGRLHFVEQEFLKRFED